MSCFAAVPLLYVLLLLPLLLLLLLMLLLLRVMVSSYAWNRRE